VRSVENKGHVRYIKYLLSKRVPPLSIRKELSRLALASPEKATLSTYFTSILWPIIEECNLEDYYTDYLNRFINGTREKGVSPILNFDVSFEDKHADRVAFCKFIREIGVEDMWSREITRYYGGVHNIPQDESGERIIKANVTRSVENILTCPRKFVIDKLILENVANTRICKYMWDKYQIKINDQDLSSYRKFFFNFERRSLEEIIEQLIAEQNSIKSDLEILETNAEYSLGDKLAISSQYKHRLKFLDESIKDLNAKYSDVSYQQGVDDKLDIQGIVEDIVQRGYTRFKFLDRYRDRDVVRPLSDVSKILFSAIDKLAQLEEFKSKHDNAVTDKDKNVQQVLIQLYQESYERHVEEAKTKLGDDPDKVAIEGLDEV
jgi:hypothetical protein